MDGGRWLLATVVMQCQVGCVNQPRAISNNEGYHVVVITRTEWLDECRGTQDNTLEEGDAEGRDPWFFFCDFGTNKRIILLNMFGNLPVGRKCRYCHCRKYISDRCA